MSISSLSSPGEGASPEDTILQISLFGSASQALATIITLGIPDLLGSGSQTVETLAQQTNSHASSLYRVMRFLSGFGIFHEDEQHQFHLTEVGQVLRSDVSTSPAGWAAFHMLSWRGAIYQALPSVVQSGQSAYHHLYGKPIYDVFTTHPEYGQSFNLGMKSWSAALPDAICNAYDFSWAKLLVDVGGGHGHLVQAILHANHDMHGILFDRPHVIAEAQQIIDQDTVTRGRFQAQAGDFLEAVPANGDIYLIASVLMDWSDEDGIRILQNCQRTMRPGGRILILEPLIGNPNEATLGKFLDITIMLETSGRVRSVEEFSDLVQRAGMHVANVYPVHALSSAIIEVEPAQ